MMMVFISFLSLFFVQTHAAIVLTVKDKVKPTNSSVYVFSYGYKDIVVSPDTGHSRRSSSLLPDPDSSSTEFSQNSDGGLQHNSFSSFHINLRGCRRVTINDVITDSGISTSTVDFDTVNYPCLKYFSSSREGMRSYDTNLLECVYQYYDRWVHPDRVPFFKSIYAVCGVQPPNNRQYCLSAYSTRFNRDDYYLPDGTIVSTSNLFHFCGFQQTICEYHRTYDAVATYGKSSHDVIVSFPYENVPSYISHFSGTFAEGVYEGLTYLLESPLFNSYNGVICKRPSNFHLSALATVLHPVDATHSPSTSPSTSLSTPAMTYLSPTPIPSVTLSASPSSYPSTNPSFKPSALPSLMPSITTSSSPSSVPTLTLPTSGRRLHRHSRCWIACHETTVQGVSAAQVQSMYAAIKNKFVEVQKTFKNSFESNAASNQAIKALRDYTTSSISDLKQHLMEYVSDDNTFIADHLTQIDSKLLNYSSSMQEALSELSNQIVFNRLVVTSDSTAVDLSFFQELVDEVANGTGSRHVTSVSSTIRDQKLLVEVRVSDVDGFFMKKLVNVPGRVIDDTVYSGCRTSMDISEVDGDFFASTCDSCRPVPIELLGSVDCSNSFSARHCHAVELSVDDCEVKSRPSDQTVYGLDGVFKFELDSNKSFGVDGPSFSYLEYPSRMNTVEDREAFPFLANFSDPDNMSVLTLPLSENTSLVDFFLKKSDHFDTVGELASRNISNLPTIVFPQSSTTKSDKCKHVFMGICFDTEYTLFAIIIIILMLFVLVYVIYNGVKYFRRYSLKGSSDTVSSRTVYNTGKSVGRTLE